MRLLCVQGARGVQMLACARSEGSAGGGAEGEWEAELTHSGGHGSYLRQHAHRQLQRGLRQLRVLLPCRQARQQRCSQPRLAHLSVNQRALSVTQRALSVTQRALSVTQRALSVTQ